MSGGSYSYLYCKDACELFEYHHTEQLEDMADRFLELGYEDVARDFRRLVEYIKSAQIRVDVLAKQLKDLMHDIEWFDSADIGEESLAKTVEEYRRSDGSQNKSQ